LEVESAADWLCAAVSAARCRLVYRTYFIDARGDEALGSTWSFLDITPYGRQEEWEDSPEDWPQTPPYTWGGWHDKYDHTL
jgi:predicted dithiol-disulfide oxidoreductase (DUF899 family)